MNVFCEFHEILVKILGDVAPRSVTDINKTDKQTNRDGVFIGLLAAAKNVSSLPRSQMSKYVNDGLLDINYAQVIDIWVSTSI